MAYALTPHRLKEGFARSEACDCKKPVLNPFYAIDPELFDFHFFRFSFGETTGEVIRNRKSKFIE